MLAGDPKLAPELGVVMLTVGAAFTRTPTAAEVVVAPALSVATAVKLYVPDPRLAVVAL